MNLPTNKQSAWLLEKLLLSYCFFLELGDGGYWITAF